MNPAVSAGLAALERYADQGRREDLQSAIDSLALAGPEAPFDAPASPWRWWLAEAYWERGSLDESVADWDRAIDLTGLLVTGSEPGDEIHDPATATLAERLWRRARATGFEDVDALAGRLSGVAAREVARQIVRSYQGLALFQVYERGGRRADLDRAIDLMAEAPAMVGGQPRYDDPVWEWTTDDGPVMLACNLAHAYQTRGDGRADLDRSIEVCRAAIARHEDEPGARALLTEMLANGYDLRWQWGPRTTTRTPAPTWTRRSRPGPTPAMTRTSGCSWHR